MTLKKVVIAVSLLGLLTYTIAFFSTELGLCLPINIECLKISKIVYLKGIILPIFFLISVFALRANARIYRMWFLYSIVWISLTLLVSGFIPENGGLDPLYGQNETLIYIIFLICYPLISLILFGVDYWKLRRK